MPAAFVGVIPLLSACLPPRPRPFAAANAAHTLNAPLMTFPYRRLCHRRVNACVREYELFQRSNPTPPASPATPAAPTAATPLALLAAKPTAPNRLAVLATAPTPFRVMARTRLLIDLLFASRLCVAVRETRPADLLRDPLGALRVARRPFIAFTLPLRAELAPERVAVRRALRPPPEPRFPAPFVLVCGILPTSFPISSSRYFCAYPLRGRT